MNLIEAWKQAKGKRIARGCNIYSIDTSRFKSPNSFFDEFPTLISEGDWFSDDWEIVKEKKKVVIEDAEFYEIYHNALKRKCLHIRENFIPHDFIKIPNNKIMKMTLEWEE